MDRPSSRASGSVRDEERGDASAKVTPTSGTTRGDFTKNPVVFHYSAEQSRRVPIVVTEESAEPLPPGDPA